MSKNKGNPPFPPGFKFQRYADSAEDAIDAYTARAAELRVEGEKNIRERLRREVLASIVTLIAQGADESEALSMLADMLAESIYRISGKE